MKQDQQQHPQRGSVMVAALFVVIVLGGLGTIWRGCHSHTLMTHRGRAAACTRRPLVFWVS